MADEREEFNFTTGDFGNLTSEDLIQAGENFLNSSPDDISPLKSKKTKQETEEIEEDNEDQDKGKNKKDSKKEKKEVKEVIIPDNKVEEEDFISMMEKKASEDNEEEEGEIDKGSSTKKNPLPTSKPGEEEETEDNEEENVFNTIAKELVGLGIFSEEEDEEGNPVDPNIESAEDFAERFQVEARRHAANVIDKFLERYGDDYKDMFEQVFVKGVPPRDYLDRYTKIQSVENIDLTEEANQERVVRELLRGEGRSSEYIDKKITQMKNYGDLQDEATEAKNLLVAKEKAENDKASQNKQAEIVAKQQAKHNYNSSISRILQEKLKNKEFDSIPVNRDFAEQTMGYLTEERYQTPDRQLLTEFDKDILDLNRPENHSLKVKVAMLLQIAKEDPTLTRLAKKAVSKETNTLFQGIKRTASKSSAQVKKQEEQEPKSWFAQ